MNGKKLSLPQVTEVVDEPRSPLTANRSRCLVIQTAFLGDVVLTTPLLSQLAEQHGPVDVVTTPAASALLQYHPAVATVLSYENAARTAAGAVFGE